MTKPDPYDRRTTPPQWRSWALILIANLALYLVACFIYGIVWVHPWWAEGGRWMMFTYTDKGAYTVLAEVEVDGEWSQFDPTSVFPTMWGSGPRYYRVHDDAHNMEVVAASTCMRHPGKPSQVLYKRGRWEKQLGNLEPAGDIRWSKIILWNCGDQVTLPDGRLIP